MNLDQIQDEVVDASEEIQEGYTGIVLNQDGITFYVNGQVLMIWGASKPESPTKKTIHPFFKRFKQFKGFIS